MELADIRHQVKTRRRVEPAACVHKMPLDLIGGRGGKAISKGKFP